MKKNKNQYKFEFEPLALQPGVVVLKVSDSLSSFSLDQIINDQFHYYIILMNKNSKSDNLECPRLNVSQTKNNKFVIKQSFLNSHNSWFKVHKFEKESNVRGVSEKINKFIDYYKINIVFS